MSDNAYALARARALRIVPMPNDMEEIHALEGAVDAVERRLVEVRERPDGEPGLLVAWAYDVDPAGGATGYGPTHRAATPSMLLVLGACLRACWPDIDRWPYPGVAALEKAVLEALVPPDGAAVLEGIAQYAPTSPYKSALRTLRACGYLAPDTGDGMVRLGPLVAAWTSRDVEELRRGYDVLPRAGEEQG